MINEFLSCDWGTSSFRLRLVEIPSLKVLGEESSDEGNAATFAAWQAAKRSEEQRVGFYQAIIQKHLAGLEKTVNTSLAQVPIVISGMASSTIGMVEIPYKDFPFAADGSDLLTKLLPATADFPHDILLISGVKTDDDVMRGEEIQLVGCSFANTADDQLFLHPGTHAKHVTVLQGQAVALRTFMTGEFFALLSGKSILASSVEKAADVQTAPHLAAFEEGVRNSQTEPLLHAAFLVRTNDLFQKHSKPDNFFYLSGLLIGSELRELVAQPPARITLAGEAMLLDSYQAALRILGIADKSVITFETAEEVTLRGQYAVFQRQYLAERSKDG